MRSRPQAPQPRSISTTLLDPTWIPYRYGVVTAVYRSNRASPWLSPRGDFPFFSFSSSPAVHTLNRVLNKRHVRRGGSWKRSVRRAEQSRGSSRVRVSRGGGGGRSSYRVRCIFIRPYIIPVHAAGQSRDLRLR